MSGCHWVVHQSLKVAAIPLLAVSLPGCVSCGATSSRSLFINAQQSEVDCAGRGRLLATYGGMIIISNLTVLNGFTILDAFGGGGAIAVVWTDPAQPHYFALFNVQASSKSRCQMGHPSLLCNTALPRVFGSKLQPCIPTFLRSFSTTLFKRMVSRTCQRSLQAEVPYR